MTMSRFRSFTFLLPHLWRALLTRPITIRYPLAPLELSPHFRGRVVIDANQCRGCGLCVRDCPAFALELERESRDTFRLMHYPDRCANCGQCEASCTFAAIKQINEFVHATPEREALVEMMVERNADAPENLSSTGGGSSTPHISTNTRMDRTGE